MKLLTAQLVYEIVSAAADAGAPLTQAQRAAIEPVLDSIAGQYNRVHDAVVKLQSSNGTDPRERYESKCPFFIVGTDAVSDLYNVLGLDIHQPDAKPEPA